ncbi:hypothetical protein B0H10DRAFT_1901949 [Mycena sp. CBHHK59/15]|nr:hypothetical protein B0H10DRAFT_1901949 [Mycena sp. CBHHK59/15]
MRSQFLVLGSFLAFLPSATATVNLYNANSTFSGSTLSSGCKTALTTSIDCDPALQILSNVYFGAASWLSDICTTECSASLSSFRANMEKACPSGNSLQISGKTYPATYPADYVTYYYNATCLNNGGSFCLDNEGAYYNISTANAEVSMYSALPNAMVCDPCFLKSGQLQLQSPIAHDDDLAANWTGILNRCNTNAYTFQPPSSVFAAPGLYPTITVNGTRLESPACVFGSYTVKSGDTCTSISSSNGLVVDQLIALNGLDQACATISQNVGSTLCLPHPCKLYTVQSGDTCATIGEAKNLTFAQVVSMNFQLDVSCNMIVDKVGSTICVGLTDYEQAPLPTEFPQTTATAIAPPPTGIPTAPNTNLTTCGEWHTVVGGDTCNQLSINYGLSLVDLYFLNPMLNENCTNLFLDFAYCVEGFNVTYPDAQATGVVGPSSWPVPSNVTAVDTPYGAGTFMNCSTWWTPVPGFSCNDALTIFNITLAELQLWNPSLTPECDAQLQIGTLYCAGGGPTPTGGGSTPASTPTNVADGVITGCTNFFTETTLFCFEIASTYGITVDQFQAWNGGSNVCNVLQSGKAYCIAGPSTGTPTQPGGGATPSNVAPGVISGCTSFFTETNLLCFEIADQFSITVDQFENWNGGSTVCNVLQTGLAYCVSAPSSTGTPTQPSGGATPSNVAPGVISNCQGFFTETNLLCFQIAGQFSISVDQFEAWNGGASVCNVLQTGLAYCIQGPPAVATPTNVAPGVVAGCTQFFTESNLLCFQIADQFGITVDQFQSWNGGSNVCNVLQTGEAYCVDGP